jgi:hypothetical protein
LRPKKSEGSLQSHIETEIDTSRRPQNHWKPVCSDRVRRHPSPETSRISKALSSVDISVGYRRSWASSSAKLVILAGPSADFAQKSLPNKILFPGSLWIMGVFAQFQSRLPMFISTKRRTKEPALQSLGFGRLYMKENFIL